MTQKRTRKEIEQTKREKIKQVKVRYKGADCGTPAMLDEMIIEEEYRRMLWENGFERD